MLPQQIIVGLSFEKSNELWKAVHLMLDASIEAETINALSKDNKGEDRAWHCGRADALNAFKQILLNTRNDVLRDQGRPAEEHNPSENGI
ncbi:MAG: hypothetical protein ACR2IJ_08430 [Fluviibacter sp.]